MQLVYRCPSCGLTQATAVASGDEQVACPDCTWSRKVTQTWSEESAPESCLVCGCHDLWRQKDFSPVLGLLMVGTAIVLATIAWYMVWPIATYGILMVFALIDMVLYIRMKDVLVCYRCAARHRKLGSLAEHPVFDLEKAERYRQETIRMNEAGTRS